MGKKYQYGGLRDTEAEAAVAHDRLAVRYAGPRATTNFALANYAAEMEAWKQAPDRSMAAENEAKQRREEKSAAQRRARKDKAEAERRQRVEREAAARAAQGHAVSPLEPSVVVYGATVPLSRDDIADQKGAFAFAVPRVLSAPPPPTPAQATAAAAAWPHIPSINLTAGSEGVCAFPSGGLPLTARGAAGAAGNVTHSALCQLMAPLSPLPLAQMGDLTPTNLGTPPSSGLGFTPMDGTPLTPLTSPPLTPGPTPATPGTPLSALSALASLPATPVAAAARAQRSPEHTRAEAAMAIGRLFDRGAASLPLGPGVRGGGGGPMPSPNVSAVPRGVTALLSAPPLLPSAIGGGIGGSLAAGTTGGGLAGVAGVIVPPLAFTPAPLPGPGGAVRAPAQQQQYSPRSPPSWGASLPSPPAALLAGCALLASPSALMSPCGGGLLDFATPRSAGCGLTPRLAAGIVLSVDGAASSGAAFPSGTKRPADGPADGARLPQSARRYAASPLGEEAHAPPVSPCMASTPVGEGGGDTVAAMRPAAGG